MSLHTWSRLYIYVLIVGAVLYGALGPAIDHHFAERTALHGHLYLSGAPGEHAHPYQDAHTHDGSDTGGDLVFLPDRDGQPGADGSYALQWIAAAWLAILPVLLLVAVPLLAQRWPVSALVIPPTQPPRALA